MPPMTSMAVWPEPSDNGAPLVLLAWEMGGGLGHVHPLLRVGRPLAERGYRMAMVVRNLVEPDVLLRHLPFPVLQAPMFPPLPQQGPFSARSYADVLALHGFADVDMLLAMTRAWQTIIDMVKPDLVVADHSPTVCLTTWGRVPTVLAGNGFCTPPATGTEFPALQPQAQPVMPVEKLLAVIQEVQRRRGGPIPQALPEFLSGASHFITVLPEIDSYQEARPKAGIGPLEDLLPPLPPPTEPRSYFAYLAQESPVCEVVLTHLAQSGVPGQAYVRGATPALRERIGQLGLKLAEKPLPLRETFARAGVVVSHANTGIVQHALAAGRPQLLFPMHLEHALNARRLHALGVAHYMVDKFPVADIQEGLRQLIVEPRFMTRASAIAADLQARGPWDPLPAILARCEELLQGGAVLAHAHDSLHETANRSVCPTE
jgi:UDP:flavonoid glycosyltransferase YjiC (YdhE family)